MTTDAGYRPKSYLPARWTGLACDSSSCLQPFPSSLTRSGPGHYPLPTPPTIRSRHLILRPFVPADASEVQRLAGDPEVASTTATIPHPYLDGMAESWIETHQPDFAAGNHLTLAITRVDRLVGAISLRLELHQYGDRFGVFGTRITANLCQLFRPQPGFGPGDGKGGDCTTTRSVGTVLTSLRGH